MRLGLNLGYSGPTFSLNVPLILEAERLGFHSVWAAEAYGSDAVTPMAFLAGRTERIHLGTAIMQMPARTPAMTAMTATTLDQLSGGRFLLGVGASGPQVVEGWHGQPYGKPLGRAREYVSIIRAIWQRDKPLEHRGEHYRIPYAGPDATGLGKPLKSILHGRPDIPIYLAAIGPKNVALAAEIADGWLPVFFSPDRIDIYRADLESGFARSGGKKSPATLDIAPTVPVAPGQDVTACRNLVKPQLALYIGGRGGRTSTTTSPAGTATRRRPARFRSSTSRARRRKPRRRCPTRSWTRWRSAARASGSGTASPPTRRRGSRRSSARPSSRKPSG